jgi:outer membrane protein OmpA-like peptidoglycan-associated protein
MKKIGFIVILIMMAVLIFAQEADQPPVQEQTEKEKVRMAEDFDRLAYAYTEEQLLISKTDLDCCYFIAPGIDDDLKINGAEHMSFGKQDYTIEDKMFINKGSASGINEGDTFAILAKSHKISNPFGRKKLGTLYLKKALAEITCIYENSAVATIKYGCYPVHIGDILIPHKPGKTIFKKKIDYKKCILPESDIQGRVVYIHAYMDFIKEKVGTAELVTVNLGKAEVSKGDFLLFYQKIKDLPPIILGTGIVVNPQNTNSTVKVIDSDNPIEIGSRVVFLAAHVDEEGTGRTDVQSIKNEEPPIIETLKGEERKVGPGEETVGVNVFYDLNQTMFDDTYKEEIDKIMDFINSKTQYTVILRGYACSIGGMEYNLKLSKERVDKIKAYLVNNLKIDENVIESYFYGEKGADFDNTVEEERKKNRRVHIQVIGK